MLKNHVCPSKHCFSHGGQQNIWSSGLQSAAQLNTVSPVEQTPLPQMVLMFCSSAVRFMVLCSWVVLCPPPLLVAAALEIVKLVLFTAVFPDPSTQ
jgi:hypothetical protein